MSEAKMELPDEEMGNSRTDLIESEKQDEVASHDPKTVESGVSLVLFGFVIALFFIFTRYANWLDERNKIEMYGFYSDVSVMIFIGFGFLMTFLKRYGLGAVSFTYLVSAFVVLWACLVLGFFRKLGEGTLGSRINISLDLLTNAQFCAGAVMISFGGVIGKVSSDAMLLLGFFETFWYGLNWYILDWRLDVLDVGGTMGIHVFGAYFGLAATKILTPRASRDHPDNSTRYNSDIFSLIGTIFLFLYWPSFNAATALPNFKARAIMNTVLSIMGSTLGTFLLSRRLRGSGKFAPVDIQNATLAGGVAVGSCANILCSPGGAFLTGFIAGNLSTFGFNKIQPWLQNKIGLYDSCGINNLHGMPGLFGSVVAAVVAAGASQADFGDKWEVLFQGGDAQHQAALNFSGILATMIIALASGTVSALIVRRVCKQPRKFFTDADEWHVEGFELEDSKAH